MIHNHCIHCRIIERAIPACIVAEDEHALAFMESAPVAPGHVVVIAKPHAETIFDIGGPSLAAAVAMTQRIAIAVHETFAPEGLSIVQRNGIIAGQTVRHFHIDLLPRQMDDDLALNWHAPAGERFVIEAAAERLLAVLSGHADDPAR